MHLPGGAVVESNDEESEQQSERDVDTHHHGEPDDDAKVKHGPHARARVRCDDGDDHQHLDDVVEEHSDADLLHKRHRRIESVVLVLLTLQRQLSVFLRGGECGFELRASHLFLGHLPLSFSLVAAIGSAVVLDAPVKINLERPGTRLASECAGLIGNTRPSLAAASLRGIFLVPLLRSLDSVVQPL